MTDSAPLTCVDTGILLDAEINDPEVLVFRIHNARFGVHAAQVREVLPMRSVAAMPMTHPAVEGLIELYELVVPVVNLERYLYGESSPDGANDILILLETNAQYIAFRVHRIEQILRVSWRDTLPAPQLGDEASPVTSIVRHNEGLVLLVDFELVADTIGISISHEHVAPASRSSADGRATRPIIFADDSRMVSERLRRSLLEAGFSNLHGFADGEEAWDYVIQIADGATPNSIAGCIACIVTDIEMPGMDGLSLTRNVRNHNVLADVPIVVFSSIGSTENEKSGHQVGATAQVSKPNYAKLVETVAELVEAA